MTNELKTNLNVSPYFDDYDEDKNFYRILFKPKPVQAREMNQLQSILQKQIATVGEHLFQEGAMVIPGGISMDTPDSVSITFNTGYDFGSISALTDQLYIKTNTNNLNAKIQRVIAPTSTTQCFLFVDYLNSSSDTVTKLFVVDNICSIYYIDSVGSPITVASVKITSVAKGVWAKSLEGVYFVRGTFVRADEQNAVLSTNDLTVAKKVGFIISESVISETDDITLYSNALGYPNYKGAGASRLKIALTLTTFGLSDVTDNNFIELIRYDNGNLNNKVDYTNYALIEKALAQRTYEESGDYVVDTFDLFVKEHLKEDVVDGVYTALEGGDPLKFVAQVKPGIAYVKGYRVHSDGINNIALAKARDEVFINNTSVSADYGSYILVDAVDSLPPIDPTKYFALLNGAAATIGTCNVRGFRLIDSTPTFAMYIYNISFSGGNTINNVAKIKYNDSDYDFIADTVSTGIFDATKSKLLFQLPYAPISTLKPLGSADTTYSVTRSFLFTSNGSGTATVTLGSNELFPTINTSEFFVAEATTDTVGLITGATLTGSPVGKSITFTGLTNSTEHVLVAPVLKLVTNEKSKTKTTHTETLTFSGVNTKKLSKADIYRIISVEDNGTNADITSSFTFTNGQNDNWYEVGSLDTLDKGVITRVVDVEYEYFAHGSGDYFTVDSYIGLGREDIPKYNNVSLADYIDFRPVKDTAGLFTSSTINGEIVKAIDNIRCDLNYYLPRIDSVYVDSNNNFGASLGVSNDNPVAPDVPYNALKLYELYVPAYTGDIRDIKIKELDNRRYTMRDIGKLDKRISNVEYYTSLNLLEAKTNSIQVIDPTTGTNRFKNGFAVDGFTNFDLSDLESLEYNASIDSANGTLKPLFSQNALDLSVNILANTVNPSNLVMLPYTNVEVVRQPFATTSINVNPYAVFVWGGSVGLTPSSDYWKDTSYLTPITVNATVNNRTNTDFNRRISRSQWGDWVAVSVDNRQLVSFGETRTTTNNDELISSRSIPYMRSINIQWSATNMRPSTRIYPIFDNVNVSSRCYPTGGALGDPIVTSANGSASGVFSVPNTATFNFPTGVGTFELTDDLTNSNASTRAQARFLSGGSVETRRVTRTNTRVLGYDIVPMPSFGFDPIAQTFTIPTEGGCFISKIDIYFKTKSTSLPVTLQIRPTATGLPTSDIIPMAQKVLNPSEVNVSTNGTIATSFEFNDPIYLSDVDEYAIVLLANTQEYTVFISEMGQTVLGSTQSVAKQPNMGVFLTSSNASTWTPNQLQDLKFTLWKCRFSTGLTSTVEFKGSDPIYVPLDYNALTSTNASATVTVRARSHGLKAGDTVTIAGAETGNGFTAVNINTVHTVVSATIDTFTFTMGSNATATGNFGGANMTIKHNYPFNIVYANVERMALPGTDMSWQFKYKNQATRALTSYSNFVVGSNNYVAAEGCALTANDFYLKATLSSTNPNISPVIDLSGLQTVLISERVNNDSGNPVYVYVTKNIEFDNPCTYASFYIGALLPGSSTVKMYYKLITTSNANLTGVAWTELTPTSPVVNDSINYNEYVYNIDTGAAQFIGYKIKIVLLSDSAINIPTLQDFRTIALA